jgi:hypothetical protein
VGMHPPLRSGSDDCCDMLWQAGLPHGKRRHWTELDINNATVYQCFP